MATTWASLSVHHPWFDTRTTKRRLHDDDSLAPPSVLPSAARVKRRRYDSLEHGFADLSLEQTLAQPSVPHPEQPPERPLFASPRRSSNAPEQDVQMSFSTWYEPEKDRIVITSLDDSDAETDEPPPVSDVTISSALLDRIKLQHASSLPPSIPPTECQALVLYRPIVFPPESTKFDDKPDRRGESPVVENMSPSSLIPVDDDAMDVEP